MHRRNHEEHEVIEVTREAMQAKLASRGLAVHPSSRSSWLISCDFRLIMLPLQGVIVVAVEQAVAAPFASRQLADLGARVIKIERPGVGDFARSYDTTVKGLASHFVWTNRSKESLTLDLKRAEAVEVLRRLIARADVFIHNLAPGAVERLGFGSEALRAQHPRLITCEISGYGSSGPYRDKKAYDLLVQSEAGLVSITGTEDTPSKVGISIADIAAGMYAFSGVLAALLRRERTGEGAAVEVSMFDALAEWMGFPALLHRVRRRRAVAQRRPACVDRAVRTVLAGDGQVVYLGLQNEREWARFCDEVLQRPELVADERFTSNSARVAHQDAAQARSSRGRLRVCRRRTSWRGSMPPASPTPA